MAPAGTVTLLTDTGAPGELRTALVGGGLVTFQPGLTGTINLNPALRSLTISANTTVQGPGANVITVAGTGNASGGNPVTFPVFVNPAGFTTSISGLTITKGGADNTALFAGLTSGGITNLGNLTVTSDVITNNTSGRLNAGLVNPCAGGLGNAPGATLTVNGCTLSNNTVVLGGQADGIDNLGVCNVANSTFTNNNTGGVPGGILNRQGTLTVDGSLFTNNGGNGSLTGAGPVGGIDNRATCTVTNTTFSGNFGSGAGAITQEFGATGPLTVNGCSFMDNQGGGAGAVVNQNSATITNSFFLGNNGGSGGGIVNQPFGNLSTATLTVNFCTFTGNIVPSTLVGGSAIANSGATLTLMNSVLQNGSSGGGAVQNGGNSTLVIDTCLIRNNVAFFGLDAAGVTTAGGIIRNTTISGNTLSMFGGTGGVQGSNFTLINDTLDGNTGGADGAVQVSGTVNMVNCTVTRNKVAGFGAGGIGFFLGGTLNLTNCIVAGNSSGASNGFNDIDAGVDGGIVTANHCLIGDGNGSNQANGVNGNLVGSTAAPINPLLSPLSYNGGPIIGSPGNTVGLTTDGLLPGSPAINNGIATAGTPPTDERGQPRVGPPDIGAYESSGFTMRIVSGNGQQGLVGQAYKLPLVVQVTANNPAEPVAGGQVTFTGPTTGPQVTFGNGLEVQTVTIDANGQATVMITANAVPGGVSVFASSFGVTPVIPPGSIAPVSTPVGNTSLTIVIPGLVFNLFNLRPVFAVGAGPGGLPEVKVYNGITGALVFDFLGLPAVFRGGVRVAVADVNGDGFPDIIVGAGPGGGPEVAVYNGKDASLLQAFFAFPATFTGGVYVAGGDLDGNGLASIVVGAGEGGGPEVVVANGVTGAIRSAFFAYPVFFTGGVRVAVGDINGDHKGEIITGAGPGGSPEVKAFALGNPVALADFLAFPPQFTGGVYVAAGDVNGNGIADFIVGAGQGGLPEVSVFEGGTRANIDNFFAMNPSVLKVDTPDELSGVRVAYACAVCPRPQVITGFGPGPEPQVEDFDALALATAGLSPTPGGSFLAFSQVFLNGVYVGGI